MSEVPAMRLAVLRLAHFSAYHGDWPWPHFAPGEMADRQGGELVIVPAFMYWLEGVRQVYDQPMIITSGHRTAEQQLRITERRTGAHVDGMAADVQVWGESALKLLRVATGMGALGVGVKQNGPHNERYLHLDMWTKAPAGARPGMWSY